MTLHIIQGCNVFGFLINFSAFFKNMIVCVGVAICEYVHDTHQGMAYVHS